MRPHLIAAFVIVNLSGCFPIEIDVNDKGELLICREEGFFLFDPATKRTTPIIGPGADMPVFARFAPGGKQILAVVKDGKDNDTRFDLVTLADGAAKTAYRTGTGCYTRFSPDGRWLAVTQIGSRQTEQVDEKGGVVIHSEQITELTAVELATGTPKTFGKTVAHSFFRWFQDSERILGIVIEGKSKKNDYLGHLAEINIRSGAITKLVSVVGGQEMFIDLAPDNRKALLSARAVGPVDKMPMLAEDDETPATIHEIDLKSRAIRKLTFPSKFAIYSPNGKKALVAANLPEGDVLNLIVANADGSDPKSIADDFSPSAGFVQMGADGTTLPGWRSDDSVFYIASRAVYGSSRHAPWLKVVNAGGGTAAILQPYLDVGVLEASAKIANPRRAPAGPKGGIVLPGFSIPAAKE